MSLLIAIDHGNYAIKTSHFNFGSGIMELPSKVTIHDTDIVEYGNKVWALSNKRIKYMRDKTQDDRFFILSLFAIAKELEQRGITSPMEEIDLAVGLPPEHYSTLQEKFKAYFQNRGKVNFVYNNRPISIIIGNVFVFPQAFAAAASHAQELVDKPRVYIVDIGGYTTDVLLMREGQPDMGVCRSLEEGVITMYNPIIAQVSSKFDMLIDDDHINAVLQNKDTGLPAEVQASIKSAVQLHANEIINQLRELQIDLRANPVIFVGGGALLFEEYLEKSPLIRNMCCEKNPMANAIGYELLASRKLKRMAEEQRQFTNSPFLRTVSGGNSGENF